MLSEDQQQECNPAALEPASLAVALPSSPEDVSDEMGAGPFRAMEDLGLSLLSHTWLFLLGELTLVSVSQEGTNKHLSFRPVLTKPHTLTLDC